MDVVPSPKFHSHEVTVPVVVLVNVGDTGTVPVVGDTVKLATGNARDATTALVTVLVLLPPSLVAVSDTVYVPTAEYV